MLTVISPKSSAFVVQADPDHIKRVIAERRRCGIGEGFAVREGDTLATFLRELPGSRTLYIRIRSLLAGRTSAEYVLEGSGAAINAAFVDCPMPVLPAAPARRTS